MQSREGLGTMLAWLVAGALLLGMAGIAKAGAKDPGYQYFSVGDVAASTPAKTSPGLLLMGGGREIKAAFQ